MILFYNYSVIADNSLLYSGGPVYYFLHHHTESELIEMLQYHKCLAVPADTTGRAVQHVPIMWQSKVRPYPCQTTARCPTSSFQIALMFDTEVTLDTAT